VITWPRDLGLASCVIFSRVGARFGADLTYAKCARGLYNLYALRRGLGFATIRPGVGAPRPHTENSAGAGVLWEEMW